MPDRKQRPLWPLLTAAMIALPVLYIASFGPACWWIWSLSDKNPTACKWIGFTYAPCGLAAKHGPEYVKIPLCWYAGAGIPKGNRGSIKMQWTGRRGR